MSPKALRDVWQADPFRPFLLHMPDGRKILVPYRDAASLSSTGRTLHVLNDDKTESIIDAALVSDVTLHGEGAPR